MKLSAAKQNEIALNCHAVVCHRFAEMLNPNKRGKHFDWARFPDSMASACESQVFLMVRLSDSQKEAAQAHARGTGRQLAESMIRWMTE